MNSSFPSPFEIVRMEINGEIIEMPVFKNPEIQALYFNDMRIDSDLVRSILELPHESLVSDLHRVLYDTIHRLKYYSEQTKWNNQTHEFTLHALFILMEIKSESSLEVLLDLMRQDEEYQDYWFSDFVTEYFWEAIFILGINRLEALKEYIKEPDNYTYCRSEVSVALTQIALHFPERRPEVKKWYQDVLSFFIEHKDDDRIIDPDVLGLMIADLMELKAIELQSEITILFEEDLVSPGICGDLTEVLEELNSPEYFIKKREFTGNIFDRYTDALKNWHYYNPNPSKAAKKKNTNSPVHTKQEMTPKINRNDPCPCGSGVKYKKCHGK